MTITNFLAFNIKDFGYFQENWSKDENFHVRS